MKQSRRGSLLEAVLNVSSGFLLAWATWTWVIPALWPGGVAHGAGDGFLVTTVFTVVGVARTYLWRRFFVSRKQI